VYTTSDGHVAVSAGASDAVWRRFCQILGRDDLARDPDFATAAARRDRRDDVAAIVQAWTSSRPKAEVVRVLASAGVPAAPVNNVAEMVADPQVRAREMFVERDHPLYGPLKLTGSPVKMSETPGRVRWLAPMPGEHNEEIFCGLLGHSKDELARWRDEGVV
jgi:formyl-CoA transferase